MNPLFLLALVGGALALVAFKKKEATRPAPAPAPAPGPGHEPPPGPPHPDPIPAGPRVVAMMADSGKVCRLRPGDTLVLRLPNVAGQTWTVSTSNKTLATSASAVPSGTDLLFALRASSPGATHVHATLADASGHVTLMFDMDVGVSSSFTGPEIVTPPSAGSGEVALYLSDNGKTVSARVRQKIKIGLKAPDAGQSWTLTSTGGGAQTVDVDLSSNGKTITAAPGDTIRLVLGPSGPSQHWTVDLSGQGLTAGSPDPSGAVFTIVVERAGNWTIKADNVDRMGRPMSHFQCTVEAAPRMAQSPVLLIPPTTDAQGVAEGEVLAAGQSTIRAQLAGAQGVLLDWSVRIVAS